MIQHIRIGNYKSLSNLDLRLERLSVLFGPNAAGKSNFFDALQLLSRLANSRGLKEAFEAPYRGRPIESFAFGAGGIEGLLRQDSAALSIEVDVELSPFVVATVNRQIAETRRGQTNGNGSEPENHIHHRLLRYRVEIGITPSTGVLHVNDEYFGPLDRKGQPKSRPQPFLESAEGRLRLRMEGQSHPSYFDLYLDHTLLSRPHYPPHYPHLTAFKIELSNWFFYYFEPRERMRAATPVKEVRHIGLMGEDLAAFLHTLRTQDPKQFQAVSKAMHELIPAITGILTGVNKFGEVELSVVEGGTAIPARVVSEGTLRALGLLALGGVKEPPSLIAFEEPENGVHPRRIRDIADILVNRAGSDDTQVIVTTHSPILPNHIPTQSLFVCRKIHGATSIDPFSTWGPLGKADEIASGLEDASELPISERLLRGDFDG